ncbi:MAG: hypothetical protein B7Z55_13660, partial [Planctomycetales bacterium 12-60-4]
MDVWRAARMDSVRFVLAIFGWIGVINGDEGLAPWQDDANLYDVQFVGSKCGFAVGDQGIVWQTADGGTTWEPRPVPDAAMLRSASFLTDRMGWVAGTRWQPYTGLAEGVLYSTTDGGQTWELRGQGQLPALVHVRFFSPDEGIVVGRGTAQAGTGIYRTHDGGHTWNPLAGSANAVWQTAVFPNPELGVVAGSDGQLSLIGGDQLLASRLPVMGLRSIRGLSMQGEDQGWFVGDGGLVMTTASGGVVWSTPATPLPDGLRDVCDFRAIDVRQQQVWVAGSPGSVIWHSSDAGQTWGRHRTGQSLPINKLKFVSDQVGFAVGEFGVMLRTTDGGATWQSLRGAERHAAWLALVPEPRGAAMELVTRLTAEDGYRGVIWAASYSTERDDAAIVNEQLAAAVHAARGNTAGVSWQLPLDRPDLLSSGEALMQRWQSRAESRAPSMLVDELVKQLRTYRPAV